MSYNYGELCTRGYLTLRGESLSTTPSTCNTEGLNKLIDLLYGLTIHNVSRFTAHKTLLNFTKVAYIYISNSPVFECLNGLPPNCEVVIIKDDVGVVKNYSALKAMKSLKSVQVPNKALEQHYALFDKLHSRDIDVFDSSGERWR